MTSYVPLIEKWEQYLSENQHASLEDFATWLLRNSKTKAAENAKPMEETLQSYFDKNTTEQGYGHLSSEAAYMLWRLNKFLRHYTKPVFQEAGLNNHDEFAILSHVEYLQECTKKVAIEENLIDPTTGIDMIKRLIINAFLKERPNEKDKRERLISLTEKGEKTLQKIYAGFVNVQDVLVDLNKAERTNLINTLKHLDDFHTKNYKEHLI